MPPTARGAGVVEEACEDESVDEGEGEAWLTSEAGEPRSPPEPRPARPPPPPPPLRACTTAPKFNDAVLRVSAAGQRGESSKRKRRTRGCACGCGRDCAPSGVSVGLPRKCSPLYDYPWIDVDNTTRVVEILYSSRADRAAKGHHGGIVVTEVNSDKRFDEDVARVDAMSNKVGYCL